MPNLKSLPSKIIVCSKPTEGHRLMDLKHPETDMPQTNVESTIAPSRCPSLRRRYTNSVTKIYVQ